MNYSFEFDRFLSYININKDVTLLIYNYSFIKCVDCNDMYVDEFYECKCGKFRCKHHTYLKTIYIDEKLYCNDCYNFNNNIDVDDKPFFPKIPCIIGGNKCENAVNGYKDLICYCESHSCYRKSFIYENRCRVNTCIRIAVNHYCYEHKKKKYGYTNTTISLYNKNGNQCSFCKKTYSNIKHCKCSNYCNYCLALCTWYEENCIVCNICTKNNNMMCQVEPYDIHLLCYYENCTNYAIYGYYGIPLCCDKHLINDFSELCQVSMYDDCRVTNCCKLRVDNDRKCYDHTTEKNRRIIKYMITQKN